MATTEPTFAFTTKSNGGIRRQLKNTVSIINGDQTGDFVALWDTGATGTCVSHAVVTQLGLVPTGKQNIQTPSGCFTVNTYLVDIKLPNNVNIKDVVVCDSEIGNQGLGVLIGMDIITRGDFSVSNYNGQTVFSFRIPSKQMTDYVAQIRTQNITGTHGKGKRKHK